MSSPWHWYVVLGTVLSLVAMGLLLYANRQSGGASHDAHEWDGIRELDTPLPMWWVGMFVGSIVFAVAYLIWFPGLGNYEGISNWRSDARVEAAAQAHDAKFAPLFAEVAGQDDETLSADRRAQQMGRRLFINHCSTCHGIAGQGGFGFPNLTDSEWQWGEGMDAITAAITEGRKAAMPPWIAALGEDGVQDTAHYVRSLSNASHDAEAAARGAGHYQMLCTACHGPQGKGIAVLGAPSLANEHWLYGGEQSQIAFTLRHGRNGAMPSHRDRLSEDQIRILASYVASMSAR